MSIKLIGKHRAELMALAMIWIGIFHVYIIINSKILNFGINTLGFGGVDSFLLLSGFGLYFSYKKNPDWTQFLKKRFIKIYPYSIIAALLSGIYYGYFSFKNTIIYGLGLSSFVYGNLRFWFVALIIGLYLITPIYLKYFKDKTKIGFGLSLLVTGLLTILFGGALETMVYIARIPVFFLGFVFAQTLDCKQELSTGSLILIFVMMFTGLLTLYYGYHHWGDLMQKWGIQFFMFILVTPGLLLFTSYVIDKIIFVQKPLQFLGKYTFQFYLLSDFLPSLLIGINWGISINWNLFNVLILLVILVASIIFKLVIEFIIDKIKWLLGRRRIEC